MTQEVLDLMARTGFGPVRLVIGAGGTYRCEVLGRAVEVTPDGGCLRFQTAVAVPAVPAALAAERGYDPVQTGLHELAIFHRPDVVTVDLPTGSDRATVTLWLEAATASPAGVAAAALATARLADLAVRVACDAADAAEIEVPHLLEKGGGGGAPADATPRHGMRKVWVQRHTWLGATRNL